MKGFAGRRGATCNPVLNKPRGQGGWRHGFCSRRGVTHQRYGVNRHDSPLRTFVWFA